MGRFPELTPVRSQVIELRLATLEAGDREGDVTSTWNQLACMSVDWSKSWELVTIPAVTPTFSSPSHPAASPEVPRDTSSSHMPLGSHVIHPRAPLSRPMPRNPVSHPRWV